MRLPPQIARFLSMAKWKWILLILSPLLIYLGCCNHVEPNEFGLARSMITGKTWPQTTGGWYWTGPWVRVSNISLSPIRVAVDSAGRGYNAKLVQFDPEHWQEFLATEGFRYYWWDNRFSFNSGYSEEHRGMRDLLRGYAYSNNLKPYPFIKIVEENLSGE